jgi:hypothetical protein
VLSREDDILHALRRNGVGARVLVALRRLGPCSIGRLSQVTGSSRQRVRRAIRGRHPDCRREHSLEGLGFVVPRARGRSAQQALTVRGFSWSERVERGLAEGDAVGRELRRRAR